MLATLVENWDEMTLEERRRVVGTVFAEIYPPDAEGKIRALTREDWKPYMAAVLRTPVALDRCGYGAEDGGQARGSGNSSARSGWPWLAPAGGLICSSTSIPLRSHPIWPTSDSEGLTRGRTSIEMSEVSPRTKGAPPLHETRLRFAGCWVVCKMTRLKKGKLMCVGKGCHSDLRTVRRDRSGRRGLPPLCRLGGESQARQYKAREQIAEDHAPG
jgi:hypothetical protein